jgi:hypothetical protein
MFWIELTAESVSTVLQKLFPLLPVPPARLASVTAVPDGDLSVSTRSPTQL